MAKHAVLRVNTGAGDAVTPLNKLTYKVYNGTTLVKTFGSIYDDITVKEDLDNTGYVLLTEIPVTEGTSPNWNVEVINESLVASAKSASVQKTVQTESTGTIIAYTHTINYRTELINTLDWSMNSSVAGFNSITLSRLDYGGYLFADFSGSLGGFSVKTATAWTWLLANSYKIVIEFMDQIHSEVTKLKSYNSYSGATGAYEGNIDHANNRVEVTFKPQQDGTGDATFTFSAPTTTNAPYTVRVRSIMIYDLGAD